MKLRTEAGAATSGSSAHGAPCRALAGVLMGLALLLLSGCSPGTTGPPHVGLSILAPTDGSTVGVRAIEVVGKVAPGDARVLIGGRPVRVRKGAFRQPLVLLSPNTHIVIKASAQGFRGAATRIAVRYSPRIFHRHRAAPASRPAPAASLGSPRATARRQRLLFDQANETRFIGGCSGGGESDSRIRFCTCVWDAMARSGLDNEAAFRRLLTGWRRSFLTRGVIVYPPVLKNAIIGCIATLKQQ